MIPTPPDDDATLTIHSRFCPEGYEGSPETYYEVCDPFAPGYPQTFFIRDADHPGWGLHMGEVDEIGNITITGIAPGNYSVTQGFPGYVVRLWVYGSRDWNPDDRLAATTEPWYSPNEADGRFSSTMTLEPNANILCDFYAFTVTLATSSSKIVRT